jgi:hypothetical protein
MSFPALPAHPDGLPWSGNVEHVYQIITTTFDHASRVLSEEADSSRLRYHADVLTKDAIPLLAEMELHAQQEALPIPWLHLCARLVAELVVQFLEASETSSAK